MAKSQSALDGLVAKWRVTDSQSGQGPAGNKARRKCADELQAVLAAKNDLITPSLATTLSAREDGRCLHGVRLPHECKDCQDAVTEGETQQSLRADCYDMIAEILEDNDMAGSSIVDSVQDLVDRVKATPPTAQGTGEGG